MEAHGGYTFCAVSALVLLGQENLMDPHSLLKWLSFKQLRLEGGFSVSLICDYVFAERHF